ncbi:hypothetical protein [Streptomyces sp. GbtcB7]|uniref:hypothetical protein n=1 Tax=Streptomyces sp. GbtcB7 TaxID=2824752 RepID=UPI001C30DFF8|nr:hypothetical protein [Streptomyces sp. GbtcB7]
MIDLTCDDALTAEDIHRAVHSLARLTAHLRVSPDNVGAAVLLAPLVHAAPPLSAPSPRFCAKSPAA